MQKSKLGNRDLEELFTNEELVGRSSCILDGSPVDWMEKVTDDQYLAGRDAR